MPAALAKAMTVSEPWNPPADGAARTVCALSVPLARAHHISESPDWALLRLASVQVSPAPVTVNVCRPPPAGPSAETNATIRSLAVDVVMLGLVIVPEPSVKTVLSTVTGPTVAGVGVTAFDGAEAGPVPVA